MRELTKSMLSFSWAMPIFGMKQMMDIALPRDMSRPFGQATDSFNAVTDATQNQLGDAWRSAFRAGDQLQRGMVDLMFGLFSFDAFNPNRLMQMTSGLMQSSMGALGQVAGGCGCGTAPDTGTRAGSGQQAGWGPIPAAPPAPPASGPTAGAAAGWTVAAPSGV
jgi:hypothetical protein